MTILSATELLGQPKIGDIVPIVRSACVRMQFEAEMTGDIIPLLEYSVNTFSGRKTRPEYFVLLMHNGGNKEETKKDSMPLKAAVSLMYSQLTYLVS